MFNTLKRFIIAYYPLLLILTALGFFLFSSIGHSFFWDWDECIYAEYAKEMHQTGNFLTNQWNHILGFEKPPLYALFLQIPFSFGFNEFNGRILSVFFSLGIITLIYLFSKKYFSDRVAILASLLAIVGEAFTVYTFRINTDLPYTFFIFGCFFAWVLAFKKPTYACVAGILLALAVYVKGLSVLSFVLVLFLTVFLPYKKEKLLNFFKMISLFLIMILPWHIYQFVTNHSKFLYVYFYENLIKRANNPIEFHFTSRLFYFRQLNKELFPWIYTVFIIPLFYLFNIKKITSFPKIKKEIKEKELLIVISLLILIPLAILTKAQTRLQWYLIPLYPFLAILMAYLLEEITKKIKGKWIIFLLILLVAFDAFQTVRSESLSMRHSSVFDTARIATLKKAAQEKQSTIVYLVPFSERRAKQVLTPNLYTTTTFTYGGNTCAPYYSNKQIQFYYEVDDFKKQLKKGLFLIENGDLWVIKDMTVRIVYQNSDFTLFER
jgi:4-amino-4-deoxy-L-arabinose transferase-like glycosyltransferase